MQSFKIPSETVFVEMEQSVALLPPQSNGPSAALSKAATVNVNVGGRRARLPSELVRRNEFVFFRFIIKRS